MIQKFIFLYKSKIKIEYKKDRYNSIMHCLEKNKILIEYQCKQGICGVCKISLIEGTVKYFHSPIAFLKKKEILTCCCIPFSKFIYLKL